MDFVTESVCIALTLILGIFFRRHGVEEALDWASGQLGSVLLVPPTHCVTLSSPLSFLIYKIADLSDPF